MLIHFPDGCNDQNWARSKPGASSKGPRCLDHLLLHFPCHQQGAESKVEQLGQKLAPIWDAGISGGSCTCYATSPAPSDPLSLNEENLRYESFLLGVEDDVFSGWLQGRYNYPFIRRCCILTLSRSWEYPITEYFRRSISAPGCSCGLSTAYW